MIDMIEKFNKRAYVIMTSSDPEQRTIITAVNEQLVMRPTGPPTWLTSPLGLGGGDEPRLVVPP